jgi:hypothetical protein
MPARNKPAAKPINPKWQERIGFHAALLRHFKADDVATLRGVGRLFFEMALGVEKGYDPEEESTVTQDVRAALSDLELLRDFLFDIGQRVVEMGQELPDARLCLVAAECGQGVGRVVEALEAGLRSVTDP